jgi:hypothetical protein
MNTALGVLGVAKCNFILAFEKLRDARDKTLVRKNCTV